VEHAFAHIRSIVETGGEILGIAAVDLAGLPEQLESLAIPTWGFNVPVRIAQSLPKGA
jgi:hypothetical protein